jgi:hypothetical protein
MQVYLKMLLKDNFIHAGRWQCGGVGGQQKGVCVCGGGVLVNAAAASHSCVGSLLLNHLGGVAY